MQYLHAFEDRSVCPRSVRIDPRWLAPGPVTLVNSTDSSFHNPVPFFLRLVRGDTCFSPSRSAFHYSARTRRERDTDRASLLRRTAACTFDAPRRKNYRLLEIASIPPRLSARFSREPSDPSEKVHGITVYPRRIARRQHFHPAASRFTLFFSQFTRSLTRNLGTEGASS